MKRVLVLLCLAGYVFVTQATSESAIVGLRGAYEGLAALDDDEGTAELKAAAATLYMHHMDDATRAKAGVKDSMAAIFGGAGFAAEAAKLAKAPKGGAGAGAALDPAVQALIDKVATPADAQIAAAKIKAVYVDTLPDKPADYRDAVKKGLQ